MGDIAVLVATNLQMSLWIQERMHDVKGTVSIYVCSHSHFYLFVGLLL